MNTSQTLALTTESQTPVFIHTTDSHMMKALNHTESHKSLGCMLCACPGQDSDVEYHLQQVAKVFHKHRCMLKCKDCSIKHGLLYLEAFLKQQPCGHLMQIDGY